MAVAAVLVASTVAFAALVGCRVAGEVAAVLASKAARPARRGATSWVSVACVARLLAVLTR